MTFLFSLFSLKLGCETSELNEEAVALRYNRSEPLNPSSPACEYPQVCIEVYKTQLSNGNRTESGVQFGL